MQKITNQTVLRNLIPAMWALVILLAIIVIAQWSSLQQAHKNEAALSLKLEKFERQLPVQPKGELKK